MSSRVYITPASAAAAGRLRTNRWTGGLERASDDAEVLRAPGQLLDLLLLVLGVGSELDVELDHGERALQVGREEIRVRTWVTSRAVQGLRGEIDG